MGATAMKPRPAIARFLDYNDVINIKKRRRNLPVGINVSDDLPAEIRQARARLMPELTELKRNNKNAWITYPACLIVEVQEVRKEIPETRQRQTVEGSSNCVKLS